MAELRQDYFELTQGASARRLRAHLAEQFEPTKPERLRRVLTLADWRASRVAEEQSKKSAYADKLALILDDYVSALPADRHLERIWGVSMKARNYWIQERLGDQLHARMPFSGWSVKVGVLSADPGRLVTIELAPNVGAAISRWTTLD